jgi:hypothetical protein
MKPRGIAGWLTGACLLLTLAVPAWACRCPAEPSAATAYQRADVVVQATVLTVQGDINQDGATARLRVLRAWKRPVGAEIEVRTATTCAFEFQGGASYLLYLTVSADGAQYSTKRCMGNLPLAGADKALDWLQRHGAPVSVEGRAP